MKTGIGILISGLFLFFGIGGIAASYEMETRSCGNMERPAQGAFIGIIRGRIVLAGGYRSEKSGTNIDSRESGGEYLRSIQIFEKDSDGYWNSKESKTDLPEGTGFGSAISTPEGIAILGGRDSSGPVARCSLLRWSDQKNDLEWVRLSDLPFPAEAMAGDYYRGQIWLCGSDPQGSSFLLSLDMKKGTVLSWQRHPPFPGSGRKQAVAVIGNDSKGKALFLFGGISPNGSPAEPKVVVFHFDDESWSSPKIDFPTDFFATDSTGFRSGTIHLILIGGKDPAKKGSKPSRTVWAYNTITNQLFPIRELPEDPCAIPAVQADREIILLTEKAPISKNVELLSLFPGKKSNRLGILNKILFVVYFLFLLWMGWSFLKRMKGADDFFRAGHRIPWWAVGISIYGTITSAITYITVPAKSFMTDWKLLLLGTGPLIAVPILSRWYIPRLARFDFTSAYEYLEYRFHPGIRFLGSLTFIVFQISRIAILLFLPAIAFHSITGIEMPHCILAMGITGILCTLAGGIEIVIWIEVFQVLVLLAGFLLTLGVIVFQYDGSLVEMLRIASENGKLHCIDPALNFRTDSVWTVLIAAFFLYLIPYASDQTILQRYFTGKNTSDRQRGIWISAGLAIPNIFLLFLLGTLFYVFYRSQPEALPADFANNDALLPWFFITQLPDGISGVLLLALITSAISSVSSGINAISAAYTVDFHERLFRFSKKNAMQVARVITLISGSLGVGGALIMATWDIASLWDQYNLFIGLISSCLAGLFLLGIFTRRANTTGIILGLLISAAIQYLLVKNGTVHFLLYSGTGVVSTMIFGYLASLPFPSQSRFIKEEEK